MKESKKDLGRSCSIFSPKHGTILNSSPSPHKLPVAVVCSLQESATEKLQFASGASEQQTISITFSKSRKRGVNCAAARVCV